VRVAICKKFEFPKYFPWSSRVYIGSTLFFFLRRREIGVAATQNRLLLICNGLELRHNNTERKTDQLDSASAQCCKQVNETENYFLPEQIPKPIPLEVELDVVTLMLMLACLCQVLISMEHFFSHTPTVKVFWCSSSDVNLLWNFPRCMYLDGIFTATTSGLVQKPTSTHN
jgi:hypothetical protein